MTTSQDLIKKDEECRLTPYLDTEKILTVGWGHNQEAPISQKLADLIFESDYEEAVGYCKRYSWYEDLNPARQAVIENMIFNEGPEHFAGFVNTIAFIEEGAYEKASVEMLDSLWARQVKDRALVLSEMMKTGEFPT